MANYSESWKEKLSIKSGTRSSSDIIKNVLDGGVNFSRDQVSELDLTIADKGLVYLRSGLFKKGNVITYGGLKFVIDSYSIKQEASGAVVSLTAMSRIVSKLKAQKGAKSWGKITAKQFVRSVAKSVGAKGYKVEPLPQKIQIARQKSSDSSQNESTWDVLQRLADERGAWCWEANGYLYFGRPVWFKKNPSVMYQIYWNSETSYSGALKQMPDYSYSATGDPREQMSIIVQSRDGDNVRPGHIFKLTGAIGPARGYWIVTDLDIPFERNPEMTINLKRPINPAPQQAAV